MTDCQHRLSAPSDRCHPQRSESTETPAAPFSATHGNCLVGHCSDVHMRTRAEGGQTRRMRPRGYNKGEITEMYSRLGAHSHSRGGGDCSGGTKIFFQVLWEGVLNAFVTELLFSVSCLYMLKNMLQIQWRALAYWNDVSWRKSVVSVSGVLQHFRFQFWQWGCPLAGFRTCIFSETFSFFQNHAGNNVSLLNLFHSIDGALAP